MSAPPEGVGQGALVASLFTLAGAAQADKIITGTHPIEGNNAFAMGVGIVDGLKIQGLYFTGFDRALNLGAPLDFDTVGCPALPGFELHGLEVIGNTFTNSRRGTQIFGGPVHDFEIKDNEFDTTVAIATLLVVVGDGVACLLRSLYGSWCKRLRGQGQ